MERHTFVVTFDREDGTVNKLVKVEKKSQLLEQAKRAFATAGDFRVEYFYEPYDVFVEADSLDDLPDGGKVRLIPVLKPTVLGSPAGLSTASTVDLSAGEPAVVPPTMPAVFCSPSSDDMEAGSSVVLVTDNALEELPGVEVEKLASGRAEAKEVVQDRAGDEGLVQPGGFRESQRHFFDPATLTRNLRLKLQQGTAKLDTREWSQILDSVYAKYTNIARGNEPTKNEYQAMASQILETYPAVRGGLNLGDGLVMVKRLLRDKFRNKRAALKRKLSPESRMASPVTSKHRRVAGLPNYSPVGGTDDVAMQRKINEMANASNSEDLQKLMADTFEGRRRMALKGGGAGVVTTFPRLFEDDGFYQEVDRISDERDFVTKKVAVVNQRLDALSSNLRCASKDVALKQTMSLLGTSYAAIFEDHTPTSSPGLGIKDGSVVLGDACTLVSAPTDVELLVCLVLAHSVLNMSFGKSKTFMAYFQKYLLDIDDGCPVPQKALRFHQQTAE